MIMKRSGANVLPSKTSALISKKSVSPSGGRTKDLLFSYEHHYG